MWFKECFPASHLELFLVNYIQSFHDSKIKSYFFTLFSIILRVFEVKWMFWDRLGGWVDFMNEHETKAIQMEWLWLCFGIVKEIIHQFIPIQCKQRFIISQVFNENSSHYFRIRAARAICIRRTHIMAALCLCSYKWAVGVRVWPNGLETIWRSKESFFWKGKLIFVGIKFCYYSQSIFILLQLYQKLDSTFSEWEFFRFWSAQFLGRIFCEVQIARVPVLVKQTTGNDIVWMASNSQVEAI